MFFEYKNKTEQLNRETEENGWGANYLWNISIRLGRLKITTSARPKNSPLGRFGGGWQYELGFQANKDFTGVIINLLVCSVRITVLKRRLEHEQ